MTEILDYKEKIDTIREESEKQVSSSASSMATEADMIIINGKIATVSNSSKFESSLAIKDDIIIAVGSEEDINYLKGKNTNILDAKGRTIIPGLNDSHIHIIRGGLNYNLELRWDGVPTLKDALDKISKQAENTPSPQWIRVVGGWSEFQFKDEQRMPSIKEIENYAKDVPTYLLHLYHCAIINKAALKVTGYNEDTPNPPDAEIERDKSSGSPTGLITARPAATILYQTLAKGPKLTYDEQINSTRQFMYELNRFGVTSAIDAGGGSQNYPDDYKVIEDLSKQNLLTVRIAYNLFTQNPKKELDDFNKWIKMVNPGEGSDYYRLNGAGEMLVFSAADWENTLEPRPELTETMEAELKSVVQLLVKNRWPFRIHATYNESITRFLNVFEEVNKEIPFNGLRWFFDHAETISEKNIERVKALGGGIAVQNRLAFQGEHFIERYGKEVAEASPPIRTIIEKGVPLGAGTDATRVSSYNPWVSLYWLISGKSVGGNILRSKDNCLDRMTALRAYTLGSAWFSGEENKKGSIEVGKLGDIVILSKDYFEIPEEEVKNIAAVLTIVGGKIVYATEEFSKYAPQQLPVKPTWSPVAFFGGYTNPNFHSDRVARGDRISTTQNKNKPDSESYENYEIPNNSTSSLQGWENNDTIRNSLKGSFQTNSNNKNIFSCPCCDEFFSF